MSDFFREHFVVHTHIEKTAGSSPTRGFIDAFGEDRIWGVRGKKHPKPEFISVTKHSRISSTSG